jgi:hypothetical protein
MFYGLVVFIIIFVLIHPLSDHLASRHKKVEASVLKWLFYYHFFLWLVYYFYALNNPSDSNKYFEITSQGYDETWFSFYGISTTFIRFVAYPFINFFDFTYEAIMVVFGFLGYLGFVFLYIFFRENLSFHHKIYGINLVTLIFFLPNTHFWTVSFGKGSLVFCGIGLFFYGISRPGRRILPLLIGALIIYHVRSHILFVMVIATFLAYVTGSGRVSLFQKSALIIIAAIVFLNIYQDVLRSTGLEVDFFEESTSLSLRAQELSKATSGVNIHEYSTPFQLFTFWFRPLFFDAPGLLGLIVSMENLITLVILLFLIGWGFLPFLFRSDPLVKSSILTFLLASYPLAQVSGNLGIALRQKSMVMLLLFFALLVYQDRKKLIAYKNHLVNKKRKEARLRSLHLETK